jgi:Alternative oxidase
LKRTQILYKDTLSHRTALRSTLLPSIYRLLSQTDLRRIEAEELKQLLRRHPTAFTEDEIVEIGELFYAGKSGGSVSFDRFVEAIDKVVHLETEDGGFLKKDPAGNPLELGTCGNEFLFFKHHANYTKEELNVKMTHTEPDGFRDRLALQCSKVVRWCFDNATGWNYKTITPNMILQRAIYLETIAAVPGMVAAIVSLSLV